jgi:hypothetical protein
MSLLVHGLKLERRYQGTGGLDRPITGAAPAFPGGDPMLRSLEYEPGGVRLAGLRMDLVPCGVLRFKVHIQDA